VAGIVPVNVAMSRDRLAVLLRADYTAVEDDAGHKMTTTLTPRQQQALAGI